jgi:hypothetical protein
MNNFQLHNIHIFSYSNKIIEKNDGIVRSTIRGNKYPNDFNEFMNSKQWLNSNDELYLTDVKTTIYEELFISYIKEKLPNKYKNIIDTEYLTSFTAYKYDKNSISKKKFNNNCVANIIILPPIELIGEINGGFLRIYQDNTTFQDFYNINNKWNIVVFDSNLQYEITKINEGTQVILYSKLEYNNNLYKLVNSYKIPDDIQEYSSERELFEKIKKEMIYDLENIDENYSFDFEYYKKMFNNLKKERKIIHSIENILNTEKEFIIVNLYNYYDNFKLLQKEDFELYTKIKEKYKDVSINNLEIEDYLYNDNIRIFGHNKKGTYLIIHQYEN